MPEETGTLHPCSKCGCACSTAEGAILRGQSSLQCKSCTNLYQILYRHCGGLPPSFQGMEPQQQQEFFKKTGKAVQACPKNARWSLIRANVISSVTEFHTNQVTTNATRDFLPLSAWAVKGFNTDDIQARGEKRTCHVPGPLVYVFSVRVVRSGVSACKVLFFISGSNCGGVAVCPLNLRAYARCRRYRIRHVYNYVYIYI